MAEPRKNKKVNVIYFIGSGKTRSLRFPLYLVYISVSILIGLMAISGILINLAGIQRDKIGNLEGRVVELKTAVFAYEVSHNDILNEAYRKQKSNYAVSKEPSPLPLASAEAREHKSLDKNTTVAASSGTRVIASANATKRLTPTALESVQSGEEGLSKKTLLPAELPSDQIEQLNGKLNSPSPTKAHLSSKSDPQGDEAASSEDPADLPLSISSVKFSKKSATDLLEFRLNNNSRASVAYRGYLIAKARFNDQEINELKVESTYPKGVKFNGQQVESVRNGYLFRIKMFKNFKINLKSIPDQKKYSDVTFFIFSDSRKLIYQKSFNAVY